jgi:hypothetical protein
MGRSAATVVAFLAVVGVAVAVDDTLPRIPAVSALDRRKLAATLAKAARPCYNPRLKLEKGRR